jgi:hypothetical protein
MKILYAASVLLIGHLSKLVDAFSPNYSRIPTFRHVGTASQQLCASKVTRSDRETDDEFDNFSRSKGGRPAKQELGNMKYVPDDDYEDDEDDLEIAYFDDDEYVEEDDEYIYDEDDAEDLSPQSGIFGWNSRQRVDPFPEPIRQGRRQQPSQSITSIPNRQSSNTRGAQVDTLLSERRAPSSEPSKENYDRLLRYGLDEDDDDWRSQPYDNQQRSREGTRRTINERDIVQDRYDERPSPRRRERRIPEENDIDNYDMAIDDDFLEEEDDTMRRSEKRRSGSIDYNPPSREAPGERRRSRVRESPSRDVDERSLKRQRRQRKDWLGEEISSWFETEDTANLSQNRDDPEGRPSRRRRSKSRVNPIVKFLDSLLDLNRQDMETKAEIYEQKLGRRRPKPQARKSRPRFDYDFLDEGDFDELTDDEEDDLVVDIEDEESATSRQEEGSKRQTARSRMSWEERSRRLEQVPPAGVPSWGPSGDLGIDARTKAMLDAMADLAEARDKLQVKTERTKLARDEIVILRADAALEQKKGQSNPQRARERMRYIQLDIEDAARDLRRAQKAEQYARERLEALQDKHWAVLSLYDVEKASRDVDDSLAELSRQEAAAQIDRPDVVNDAENAWPEAAPMDTSQGSE